MEQNDKNNSINNLNMKNINNKAFLNKTIQTINNTNSNSSIILTRNIFLRLMALVYLFAFLSSYVQIQGLWGDEGILPANLFVNTIKQRNKDNSIAFLDFPSISFHYSDKIQHLFFSILDYINLDLGLKNFSSVQNSLHLLTLLGIFISISIVINIRLFYNMFGFGLLFIIYMNVYLLGQTFMSFQWDIYLLESGFLTIFVAPLFHSNLDNINSIEDLVFDLIKLLNFRFMYSSGVVKITSYCPTWLSFTALHHHFQSQPLPNILGYYSHFLSDITKKILVAGTFIVELYIPFLLCLPKIFRRLQIFGGIVVFLFEIGIILTGNYNFFNILTIVINLSAFDDSFFRSTFGSSIFKIFSLDPLETIVEKIEKSKSLQIEVIENEKFNTDSDFSNNQNENENRKERISSIYQMINQKFIFQDLYEKTSLIFEIVLFIIMFSGMSLYFFYFIYPISKLSEGLKIDPNKDLKVIFEKDYLDLYLIVIFCILFGGFLIRSFKVELTILLLKYRGGTKIEKYLSAIYYLFRVIKNFFFLSLWFFYYIHMSSVFQRSLGLTLLPKNENSNERSLLSYLHEVETIGNNYFGKLHTTYGYGLFRVMTGVGGRPELEIFYSDKKYPSDKDWKILNFVYKPQDHKSQLSLNIPHQPRIDWQIWFSALRDNFNSESWLIVLCGKVLEKNSLVLDLLGYKVKEKELYYNYSIFDNLYDKFMGWEKQEMLETPTFVKINSYIYYFNPDFTYTSDSKIWLKKFNKQWLPQINSEMLNDFWNQIKYPKLGKNKKVKFSLFQLLPLIDISILAISIYVLVSFLRLKN